MTRLLAAPPAVAGSVAALLLVGLGSWFQISRLGRLLTARADPRADRGKHPGPSPASTTAVSPSRWRCSGKLPLPGRAR